MSLKKGRVNMGLLVNLKKVLQRPEIISYRALIIYLMAFLQLMMIYEELEETLIMGDIGVRATDEIIEDLKG